MYKKYLMTSSFFCRIKACHFLNSTFQDKKFEKEELKKKKSILSKQKISQFGNDDFSKIVKTNFNIYVLNLAG